MEPCNSDLIISQWARKHTVKNANILITLSFCLFFIHSTTSNLELVLLTFKKGLDSSVKFCRKCFHRYIQTYH